ncbi:putative PKS/NRPS-like protein biosynthetic cluster [Diaporthe eres]
MATAYKHLLIFGDQSVEKLTAIKALVQSSKSDPAARRFLQEAIDVIQLEFSRLGPEQHGWHKTLDSLLGLAEEYDASNDDNIIDIPGFRRVTIGVEAKDWLTLIGPPSSLKQLASWSPEIRDASHIRTSVTGPIHTKHAPKIDIPKVLGNSPLLQNPIDHAKARMLSPSSCKQYSHPTLGDLLGEIVEDIAHNVLRVTDVVHTCVSTLDETKDVRVSVMGPTNHLAAVKMALQANGIGYQVRQPVTTPKNENSRGGSDLIAIVGIAGRFPGSDTVDGFWEDLMAGKCHIKEVPKSRFDLDSCYDSSGEEKNSTTARHGAWIDNPGFFDYRLFNISPREAAQLDPGHRLLLMVAYEALQSAGYSNSSLANGSTRIASYFGQAADEWREILNRKGADIHYVPGFSRAFGVGRLNFHFNWSGSAVSLDTACSTSSTGVNLARSALTARECDMALAGGYSVINSPTVFSGLSRSGMLSTTGGCRTFHADADGYARAEGAGVVVLKRLEDAISDNDNILAVIRGSARMHSPTADSMTHPSAASQQMAYNEVLRQSALSEDEIAYVEMHGTGTQAGDFEEMSSVVNTFATRRKRDNPLTVGAVKAAVGHGEGAAGVTSLIKTILMLRERAIPPQPGWPFTLNPTFPPLAKHNVRISTKTTSLKPSPKGDKKIKMLVNSFDASSTIKIQVALTALEIALAHLMKCYGITPSVVIGHSLGEGTTFLKPDIPIASTLSGKIETEVDAFSNDYLARQARQKVDFVGALRAIEATGSYGDDSLWLEVGPEPVCSGLACNTLHLPASQTLPTIKSGESNWRTVSTILKRAYESGISVNWAEVHREFKDSLTVLDLPFYAFDCQDFWTPYVKPDHVTESSEKSTLAPAPAPPMKSRQFLTNSIQHVEDEVVEGQSIKAVFVSDISDPCLLKAIHGHAVLGHTICSLGIFHDMALTAAKHVYGKLHNQSQTPSMSIRDINITQALSVCDPTVDSVIRVAASYHATENGAHIQFSSKTGDKTTPHAECRVVFDADPVRSLDVSQSFLLRSRINWLKEQAKSGGAHRLLKPIVYQLFSNIVQYSSTYQLLEDVTLDAASNDAVASVKIPEVSELGKFHLSPYWADVCVQLTGFVVNSGLKYPKDLACLATGFDSWQSTKDVSAGKTYTVYACLQDTPNSHVVQGDCYVFQDDEIIQVTKGIKFLKLNRVAAGGLLANPEARQKQPSKARLEPASQTQELSRTRGTTDEHKDTVADSPHKWPESFATTHGQTDIDDAVPAVDIARMIEQMISIVAHESGYDTNEMTDDTMYTDLGIDSVMAINILAKLASQADMQLPAAFFLENKTIGDSKQALRDLLDDEPEIPTSEAAVDQQTLPSAAPSSEATQLSPVTSFISSTLGQSSIAASNDTSLEEVNLPKFDDVPETTEQSSPVQSGPRLVCKAIQYQRGRSEDSKKLFFVADETGSTLDFIHLPKLEANVGVYGIESPLSGNVAGIEVTFEELTSVYRAAIQKEQPSGPYLIGGVSAGAIIAYEVARQLLEAGEKVQGLLILDCDSTKVDPGRVEAADTDAAMLSPLARPDQKEHVQKIISLCNSHQTLAFSQLISPRFTVQVLGKDQVASSEWQDLIPGLVVQKGDIESGSFLEFSSVSCPSEQIYCVP